jgi:hypothetical protein
MRRHRRKKALPNEIRMSILIHLSFSEILAFATTNKEMYSFCLKNEIWEPLFKSDHKGHDDFIEAVAKQFRDEPHFWCKMFAKHHLGNYMFVFQPSAFYLLFPHSFPSPSVALTLLDLKRSDTVHQPILIFLPQTQNLS